MGRSADDFGRPDYESSSSKNPVNDFKQPPKGLSPGQDPVCNGTGYLWQDAYGNQVKCWRCVGTGNIPNLIPIKQNQKISEEAEGDGNDTDAGLGFAPDVTQEGQIVSLNQSTGD